nr:FeoB-associated Cys-rich membrane protein [uncultured Lacibacter sp.]
MNWPVLIVVGMLLLGLIVFLIRRNVKDEKKFEQQANEDYHKSKNEEGDAQGDDITH